MEYNIVQLLNPYLDLKKPDYAIMINGKWGSGKTFFLKNELPNSLKNAGKEIRVLYCSANGIKTFDEISNTIKWSKLRRPNEKIQAIGKVGGKILSSLPLDWIGDFAPGANVARRIGKNATQSLINNLDALISYSEKDLVIIDDIERVHVDCDLIGLLGEINTEFVEHNNVKTLLICDEPELIARFESKQQGDRSLKGTPKAYKDIREKLVRRVLKFQIDIGILIPKLIEKLEVKNEIKDYLIKKTNYIIPSIKRLKIENLRKVKLILENLAIVFMSIPSQTRDRVHKKVIDAVIETSSEFLGSSDEPEVKIWGKFRFSPYIQSINDFILDGIPINSISLNNDLDSLIKSEPKYTEAATAINKFHNLDSMESDDEVLENIENIFQHIKNGEISLNGIATFLRGIEYRIDNNYVIGLSHTEVKNKISPYLDISAKKNSILYNFARKDISDILNEIQNTIYDSLKADIKKMVEEKLEIEREDTIYSDLIESINKREFNTEDSNLRRFLSVLSRKKLDKIISEFINTPKFRKPLCDAISALWLRSSEEFDNLFYVVSEIISNPEFSKGISRRHLDWLYSSIRKFITSHLGGNSNERLTPFNNILPSDQKVEFMETPPIKPIEI